MRLAVISDSHLSGPDARIEDIYERFLAPADFLLHCGDMVGEDLYHYLARHPNFLCVRGNCDYSLTEVPPTLSRAIPLPGGGELLVGMAHGWGERSSVWRRVAELFPGHGLVCYGHTHRRDWDLRGGSWILNPGSLAEGSLAVLEAPDHGGPDGWDCRFVDV